MTSTGRGGEPPGSAWSGNRPSGEARRWHMRSSRSATRSSTFFHHSRDQPFRRIDDLVTTDGSTGPASKLWSVSARPEVHLSQLDRPSDWPVANGARKLKAASGTNT